MHLDSLIRQVFNVSSKDKIICPPELVFANPNFVFLIAVGGYLTDNQEEYNKIVKLLHELREDEFFLVENLGATVTGRTIPFKACIPLKGSFDEFTQVVNSFDPPFGVYVNHFYVFGQNPDWGIYVCECPTINIIGCKTELRNRFAEVFSIEGNGYTEVKEFVSKEWQNHPHLQKIFETNYALADLKPD